MKWKITALVFLVAAPFCLNIWQSKSAERDFRDGVKLLNAGNTEDGIRLLSAAASNKHARANFMLGRYYKRKSYTENNPEPWENKAAKFYLAGAELGDRDAQDELGICYRFGQGVPEVRSQAFYWWLKAAEAGHTEAQLSVAAAYREGKGVPKNLTEAYAWFNIASARNEQMRC